MSHPRVQRCITIIGADRSSRIALLCMLCLVWGGAVAWYSAAFAYAAEPPVTQSTSEPAPANLSPSATTSRGELLIVIGAAGEAEYAEAFRETAERWQRLGQSGLVKSRVLGPEPDTNISPDDDRAGSTVREQLLSALTAAASQELQSPLWVVLVGHGTADARRICFNLIGPDLTPADLSGALAAARRPIIVVCGFSASGAFLPKLAGPGRTIVTATRGGQELNFSRFGGFLAEALADRDSDLDQDGQVSLWEAFLIGSRRTAGYYAADGRLATEHPLLDDNGDSQGTMADAIHGWEPLLAVDSASGPPRPGDGWVAHGWHLTPALSERDWTPAELAARQKGEQALRQLRARRGTLSEDELTKARDSIIDELRQVYRSRRSRRAEAAGSSQPAPPAQ